MKAVILADFGSTFTKITVVEDTTGRLLATAQAPTTVRTDVMEGYRDAVEIALAAIGQPVEIVDKLAASSAGGGLRLAAVGLVPEYTAAAARQAALNAGAKIELLLSGRIGHDEIAALEASQPEILLFSGGTDGGQRSQILDNAAAIAEAQFDCHVVVSCNKDVADDVASVLAKRHASVEIVDNVLPAIRTLNIEPARHAIHESFIRHVIRGKGLSRTTEFGDTVIMPTPEAVLEATRLLAMGDGEQSGCGDVIVVDIGGATTDVHSCVSLRPRAAGIHGRGLPPLPLTRSVEGDLGMRWSALGVLRADGDWLRTQSRLPDQDTDGLNAACRRRHQNPDYLPDSADEEAFDRSLAVSCITHALRRHCGTLSTIYVPGQGTEFVQEGADMSNVPVLVGTGGMLVRDPKGTASLKSAIGRRADQSLTPQNPTTIIDSRYILAAAGLLATQDAKAAFGLLNAQLNLHEHSSS